MNLSRNHPGALELVISFQREIPDSANPIDHIRLPPASRKNCPDTLETPQMAIAYLS